MTRRKPTMLPTSSLRVESPRYGTVTDDLTLRDQFIISEALHYGVLHLCALEERDDPFPPDGEHAQPSDRHDMQEMRKRFDLWQEHD